MNWISTMSARSLAVRLTLVLCTVMLTASPALTADTPDAACHRVEEASEASVAADVETGLLGLNAGCVIRGGAVRVCGPTDEAVLGQQGATAVAGVGRAAVHTCYRVECPERQPTALQVSDRFGQRTVTVTQPRLLCVP